MSYKNMMTFSAVLLMAAGPAMARDPFFQLRSGRTGPDYKAPDTGRRVHRFGWGDEAVLRR